MSGLFNKDKPKPSAPYTPAWVLERAKEARDAWVASYVRPDTYEPTLEGAERIAKMVKDQLETRLRDLILAALGITYKSYGAPQYEFGHKSPVADAIRNAACAHAQRVIKECVDEAIKKTLPGKLPDNLIEAGIEQFEQAFVNNLHDAAAEYGREQAKQYVKDVYNAIDEVPIQKRAAKLSAAAVAATKE